METADVVWMPRKAAVPWACARAAVLEAGPGAFSSPVPRRVMVNGENRGLTDRVAVYVEGLEPGARNAVRLEPVDGSAPWEAVVETPPESVRLDVRDFGAAGDDTGSIQAAVSCCPDRGTVEVPAGRYRVSSLWLKDGVSLHLAEGAVLEAVYDREGRAFLPDTRRRTDTGAPYPLGTWEGEGRPMFCAVVNAVGVSDACVYGPGVVDGRATPDTWWHDPKTIRVAARPRLVFLEGCEGVTVAGCTLRNSPSWNVHPVLSRDVRFLCLTLEGPADSPNTDGVNPESCTGVLVLGCEFSVGDDCVAIKSGKLSRERALRPPCTGVRVRHCSMHDGHGAVVVGSETAGGVSDVLVEDCVFARTDRGLRVKTRRGRGRDSLVGGVVFRRISMEGVGVLRGQRLLQLRCGRHGGVGPGPLGPARGHGDAADGGLRVRGHIGSGHALVRRVGGGAARGTRGPAHVPPRGCGVRRGPRPRCARHGRRRGPGGTGRVRGLGRARPGLGGRGAVRCGGRAVDGGRRAAAGPAGAGPSLGAPLGIGPLRHLNAVEGAPLGT